MWPLVEITLNFCCELLFFISRGHCRNKFRFSYLQCWELKPRALCLLGSRLRLSCALSPRRKCLYLSIINSDRLLLDKWPSVMWCSGELCWTNESGFSLWKSYSRVMLVFYFLFMYFFILNWRSTSESKDNYVAVMTIV